MKRLLLCGLVLILAADIGSAQKKNKKRDQVPAAFQYAHFVYVEAPDGDATRFGLNAADRQAIVDVQDALQDWNRYTLAHRRKDADVVLVVSKGRMGSGQGSTGVSVGPKLPPNQSPNRAPGQPGAPAGGWDTIGAAGDVGSDIDMIRVYLVSSEGKLSGPLWTLQLDHGLDAPTVALVQRLRTAVEAAYPAQPATPAPSSPPAPTSPQKQP